ncbi:unnamed protein product [Phytophthora fragariaefolia]|uniref:Unnamed protein product n=1 Tax=Phytophthora fragariaefolia TaxID=1490495 RepID=A0A9W6TLU2_9STRA|nr:unnamed protein product [Phytophthora fragariaefolia]
MQRFGIVPERPHLHGVDIDVDGVAQVPEQRALCTPVSLLQSNFVQARILETLVIQCRTTANLTAANETERKAADTEWKAADPLSSRTKRSMGRRSSNF